METKDIWKSGFSQAQEALEAFLSKPENLKICENFSETLITTYKNHGNVFSCGNGGSYCDAMHFAEELTGRYRKHRPPLGALALGDGAHTTCVANDYGFEYVFSRQLEALGRRGDVLIGLSTSGNSPNLIRAFQTAEKKSIHTIALLGRDGGQLKSMSNLYLIAPGQTSDRIQEIHIKLLHIVIETIERALFPQNY